MRHSTLLRSLFNLLTGEGLVFTYARIKHESTHLDYELTQFLPMERRNLIIYVRQGATHLRCVTWRQCGGHPSDELVANSLFTVSNAEIA